MAEKVFFQESKECQLKVDTWMLVNRRDAKTGLFRELPPMFTFSGPVSSIDIERIPEETVA